MKHILTITDKDITGSDKLSVAEPRIAADAVLLDADGNIALSYAGKYDLHTLPGGGVEPGEDLRVAVKREMWEETGCECEITGELGRIIENRSEHDFTQERSYYIARVVGEKGGLHLTDEEKEEGTTVVWLSPEYAFKIIKEKQHDNYQRKFIQRRDIAVLTEALTWLHLHDIPQYDTFVKIEPIGKGLSSDKKYYIEAVDGQKLLLRVSDITEYNRKESEYSMMKRVYERGVFTPQPVDFGICDNGKSLYSLSGWLDGEDAETVLPRISESEQYTVGLKAGAVLHKIHTLPAPDNAEPWAGRFGRKVQGRIDFYNANPISSESGDKIIRYLQDNRQMLSNRPQNFCHGDYNIENLMLMPDGQIGVIDFNAYNSDYGDPWWEFCSFIWGAEPSAYFYTGLIKGYFDGEPPREFFEVFSYYLAYDALAALCDTSVGNQGEPEVGRRHMENILRWFDNMNNPVPSWYLKDYFGIPFCNLETNRLILRQYEESDLPEYFKLFSDRQNMYYLDDIITDTIDEARQSLKDAIEMNKKGKARRFCITLKDEKKLIGGIGYEIAENTPAGKIAAPMGWFIIPEYQNKGYITEAAERVLEFAFQQDNCVRVVTGCYKDNIPTQKVMAKVGFRKEAEKIKAQYHDGMMKDRLEYAINKDDFTELLEKWRATRSISRTE